MSSFPASLRDWQQSLRVPSLWSNLALEDLRDRYRRTFFGISWIMMSFALFVGVKILVFGQMVTSVPAAEYNLYVTIGFGVWSYINAVTVDACAAYMNARTWILGTAIPYPVFLLQAVFRNCLIFLLIMLVMAVGMIWKPTPWSAMSWFVLPALLVYPITALWLGAILAPLCARFRDLNHAIRTGMQLMFFVTPILWMPSLSPTLGRIAAVNPLTSFIDIVRMPLLYDQLPVESWKVVLWINGIGLLLGVLVYSSTRKRLAYWL